MTPPRVLASFCLLCLLSVSNLLATTIHIKAMRHFTIAGSGAQLHLHVNGKELGILTNGQEDTFQCSNVRIGINEISVTFTVILASGKERPFYEDLENMKGDTKYFVVRYPDEEITIELGTGLSRLFKVSTEVDSNVEKIELNRVLKAVIVKEEPPRRVAPGSNEVYEETVTVRHEIKRATNWKVEADLKAEVDAIWATVALGIRGKLEGETKEDNSVEIKNTRRLTISPSGSLIKMVWIDYYRTGTAIVAVKGRSVRIPFEVADHSVKRPEIADVLNH